MAGVSSRSHGGIPKLQRIVNPFDSDKDDYEPTLSFTSSQSRVSNSSSSSWSAQPSTRYTNPFDDDAKPHSPTKSKIVAVDNPRVAKSWNPFDADYSLTKLTKDVAKVDKVKSSHSNQSTSRHDTSNPFNEDYEDTFKPKTLRDTILDEGFLFDNEPYSTARPVKERKSAAQSLRAKIVEGRSRMKERASRSLSSVKLPALSSSKGHGADAKMEFKGIGKSTYQESMELFGESEPTYLSTQHNYFSQQDQRNFTNQTVEELVQYAVKTSQETTKSLTTALTIAEDTKGVATTTLETFHDQWEQFRRTHQIAVRVDDELGRGEKLLGRLGGIFSMTWKPKKAHKITGPQVNLHKYERKNNRGEKDALGLSGKTPARPLSQLSGTHLTSAQAPKGHDLGDGI